MSLWVYLHPRKSSVRLYPLPSRRGTPKLVGVLYIGRTQRGHRPVRFQVVRGERIESQDPKEALELLRKASSLCVVDEPAHATARALHDMLSAYQLTATPVEVCRHCLARGTITPRDGDFVQYGGEHICFSCASAELELELATLLSASKGSAAARYMRSLLSRVRDLDAVLAQLTPEGVEDELSLVDVLEAVDEHVDISWDDIPLHPTLGRLLAGEFKRPLPIQAMCVRAGLLEGRHMLVASQTASGKTLVGEMAGIQRVLEGRGKLLFLVPLVALAYQKYDQLTSRYELDVSLVVGKTRVWTKQDTRPEVNTSLDADVLVGTYEGVDSVLRAGGSLGRVGCVVVDEVHMLMDEERGHRLDGLIARLKHAHPDAQMLYLSATVGEPRALAKSLGAELVEYTRRPIPLRRHLIFCPSQRKHRVIRKIVNTQWKLVSSKGYRGQTIVFTSSRRRCEQLAKLVSTHEVPARAYHAGLPAQRRRQVQRQFESGEIGCVITTAALSAGVDFPASCVVFDSLAMGIKELGIGEFNQMLGRAGRPDYHDEGSVYLLVDPARRIGPHTEDEVAMMLLKGEVEPVRAEYSYEAVLEEVLASCACTRTLSELEQICSSMLASPSAGRCARALSRLGLVKLEGEHIHLSELGRVAATGFLSPSELSSMLEHVRSGTPPLDALVHIAVLDAVHLAIKRESSVSDRVFSHMFEGMLERQMLTRLGADAEKVLRFARDFLSCKCAESPFCGCPERLFSKRVIELRAEGLDPEEINGVLREEYGVYVYGGDMYTYLTQAVRLLESYERLCELAGLHELANQSRVLAEDIEGTPLGSKFL